MKKLIITEEERSRILGMHQNATSRQYLMEDDRTERFEKAGINQITPTTPDANFVPGLQGENTALGLVTTSGKNLFYYCIPDPYNQKGIKERKVKDPKTNKMITVKTVEIKNGTLTDGSGNTVNPEYVGLKGEWKTILSEYCKPLYTWYYAEKQKMESEGQQTAGQQTNTEYQKPIIIVAKGDPTKVLQQHMSAKLVTGPMNPDGSYNVINDFTYNNTPYKKGQKIKFISQ